MDEPTRFVTAPDLVPNALYDKALFHRKLTELGINGPLTDQVMAALGDQFTLDDLERTLRNVLRQQPGPAARVRADRPHDARAGQGQLRDPLRPRRWTSRSGSSSRRRPPRPTASRTRGSSGSPTTTAASRYYATYTAYDGRVILPQMLETEDFLHFKVSTLNGPGGAGTRASPCSRARSTGSTRCCRARTTRTST